MAAPHFFYGSLCFNSFCCALVFLLVRHQWRRDPPFKPGSALSAVDNKQAKRPRVAGRPPRLLVWQKGHNIVEHIYKPAMTTLWRGLELYENASKWQIEKRYTDALVSKELEKEKLQSGDVFIWIGSEAAGEVPWEMLKHRGVYRIWYLTEPLPSCDLIRGSVEELWDYSWHNIDRCDKHVDKPKQRYIPPGFQEGIGQSVQLPGRSPLNFYGKAEYRAECWNKVYTLFTSSQIPFFVESKVGNDDSFAKYIQSHDIFFNLHKNCQGDDAPIEAFRMASLISAGAIVLSVPAYAKDQAEFKDLIDFAPLGRIVAEYNRQITMGQANRQKVADGRRALFKRKFEPRAMFERAGIYPLLDSLLPPWPVGRPTSTSTTTTVLPRLLIWQKGKHKVEYMYKPAMSTLRRGLEAYANATRWKIEYRYIADNVAGELANLNLRRGDVYIWIGVEGNGMVPWAMLRGRGVYSIYYQTEPVFTCAYSKKDVDELWDYSWRNIDACDKRADKPGQRLIPPGFQEGVGRSIQSPGLPKLNFFGGPQYRGACYDRAIAIFKASNIQLVKEYGIWSDEAFARYIKSHGVFFNLHKNCEGDSAPVEAFRMACLLSAGAIVLSVHSFAKDEAQFKDLIDFAPMEAMVAQYNRIASMSQVQRQEISDRRAASFQEKFQPAAMFQRAGIYSLLDRLLPRN